MLYKAATCVGSPTMYALQVVDEDVIQYFFTCTVAGASLLNSLS